MDYSEKEELNKRWWHRLVKVSVITSSILILIFGFVIFWESWKEYDFVYSFQPDYEDYKNIEGIVKRCEFDTHGGLFFTLVCGEFSWDEESFLDLYASYSELEEVVKKAKNEGYSSEEILISLNENEKLNDIKSKRIEKRNYLGCMRNIFIVLGVALGWFVILWFVIYRIVLYIIFGEKKQKYERRS